MEKVAIVGSGIAGMMAAFLLKDKYDLTVFEKTIISVDIHTLLR